MTKQIAQDAFAGEWITLRDICFYQSMDFQQVATAQLSSLANPSYVRGSLIHQSLRRLDTVVEAWLPGALCDQPPLPAIDALAEDAMEALKDNLSIRLDRLREAAHRESTNLVQPTQMLRSTNLFWQLDRYAIQLSEHAVSGMTAAIR